MKRVIHLLFTVFFLYGPGIQAQAFLQVRPQNTPPNNESYSSQDISYEVRELDEITSLIDRFIKYTQNEEWGKAEEVKRSILLNFRDEIQQTKVKVRNELRKAERGDAIDVYINEDSNNNSQRVIKNYDLKLFTNRLDQQEQLYRKLRALHLSSSPNKWKSAKEHEHLMLRFEDTLKNEIRQMKGDL